MNLEAILEALLFVSSEPLKINRLKRLFPESSLKEIRLALNNLKQRYAKECHGIELVEVAGGFRFQTKAQMRSYVISLKQRPPLRLARATLETLAIIAYKQPITKREIEQIKGVDVSSSLKTLLKLRLIKPSGRKEGSRAMLYKTTYYFLEVFGLKSLEDLPNINDVEG